MGALGRPLSSLRKVGHRDPICIIYARFHFAAEVTVFRLLLYNQVIGCIHIGRQEQPGGPLPSLQKLGHCDLLSRNQMTR